ncbi:hypothetical protein R1sor_024708 [Riccia sorocarpa]|uniref:PGG domain-containing protein n=1 Tax=Riccia sorocarpa TaxID=122646 RepID=A0ABD3GR91_9MARC
MNLLGPLLARSLLEGMLDTDLEMGEMGAREDLLQPVPEPSQSRFLRMFSSKSLRISHIDKAIKEEKFESADELLRELLEQDGYDSEPLITSQTMLTAAQREDKHVMRLLLTVCLVRTPEEIFELLKVCLDRTSSCKQTALLWASEKGDLEMARLLLEQLKIRDSSPRKSSSETKYTTPLHLAIKPCGVSKGEDPDKELEERAELAKLILQYPVGRGMLNTQDLQGNSPLHLAVETMNVDVVEALIEDKRLLGTPKNNNGKTPYGLNREQAHSDEWRELEAVKLIGEFLLKLPRVQEDRKLLMEEKTRLSSVAMNFLLIGALLVQVSFPAILAMVTLPPELLTDSCPESPPPASQSTVPAVPSCLLDQAQKKLMKYKPYYIRVIDIFRGSNNLSFYFAIITIMAAIRLIVSSSRNIPLEKEISHMKHMNILISLALTFSTTFMMIAYVSGGLGKIPVVESGWAYVLSQWEEGNSIAILKSTMLTTNSVGLLLSSPFILIFLYSNLTIFRDYLGSRIGSWNSHQTHHSRWAEGRWQRFLTLFLAVTFFLAALFSVGMLIFGIGLLKDYIKPPPSP